MWFIFIFILLIILIILLSINIAIYCTVKTIKIGGNTRSDGSTYKIVYVTKDSEIYNKIFKQRAQQENILPFYKIINCPHFKKIEDSRLGKCIMLPSLYDQCKKIKKNGLDLCILKKGALIYKTFDGFITKEKEKEYLEKNPNGVSWYGNIYVSYDFAKHTYGGLNVYIVQKDIILFDYFNYNNLKILINFLNKIKCKKSIINDIRVNSGFHIKREDQYKQFIIKRPWDPILYVFNKPILDHGIKYCTIYNDKRLNPSTLRYDVEASIYIFNK